MRWPGKFACLSLAFLLAAAPAYSVPLKKAGAKASAKAKPTAKGTAKVKAKASNSKSRSHAKSERPSGAVPDDEARFDAEVTTARRVLAANPGDMEARDRLARAAVALVDGVLRAEAVGDTAKAQHRVQKLKKELHDTGWRVQKLARRGDPAARQATAFLLGRGILLEKDAEKSCSEFVAAAEALAPAGWHAAQCLLESAPDKGWAQMRRAAERGHAAAQEWMGRRCLGEFGAAEKDFTCARDYLNQAASQGRPRAQTLLAYLLVSGQGGPVDATRAVRLYRAAAEKGDVNAQNNLGEILETGRDGNKNPDQALIWYQRAASGGLGAAQFNAGRLLAIGVGERKDFAKARALLVEAEANGVTQARQVLDWLDRQGNNEPAGALATQPTDPSAVDAKKE